MGTSWFPWHARWYAPNGTRWHARHGQYGRYDGASDAKPANALNGRGHAPEPTIPEHDAKYVWRYGRRHAWYASSRRGNGRCGSGWYARFCLGNGGHEPRCYASRYGNGPTNDARKPRASRGDAPHDGWRTSRTTAVNLLKVICDWSKIQKSTKNRPFPLQRKQKPPPLRLYIYKNEQQHLKQ